MNTNNLGETLRERRKSKKLILKQVSDMSGVSIAHLYRIENGDRFPSAPILKKLAGPLGFGEAELLQLAGFLSHDDRVERFKMEIRSEIARAFAVLLNKLDEL